MATVREATPDDVPAIRRVHAASIRGLAASHYDDRQIGSWSDVGDADYSITGESLHVVVAEARVDDANGGEAKSGRAKSGEAIDGEARGEVAGAAVVGFGAVNLEDGGVGAVYVHPDHAGAGVGSAMLAALEERAGEAGLTDLHLTASLNAVPFYERHGWESTGPTAHELQDGVELEARAMEKTL